MSKKHIRVSIVIPAYNEERYIRPCLEAIANQTSKPFEVIVVDNNSTDASIKIAREFSFVRVVNAAQQGIVHARNAGFNAARGDVIGRIDADTILPPDWVAYIQRFYTAPGIINYAWTGGCYFYNARIGRFQGWAQGQVAFRWNRWLMGHYILFGSNMAIPRAMWLTVRGQTCPGNDIHEDLDLAIHVHQAGYAIRYDEGCKVGVRMGSREMSLAAHRRHMMKWPTTLRRHGRWTWVFGWLGATILWVGAPVQSLADGLARLFGRSPLGRP